MAPPTGLFGYDETLQKKYRFVGALFDCNAVSKQSCRSGPFYPKMRYLIAVLLLSVNILAVIGKLNITSGIKSRLHQCVQNEKVASGNMGHSIPCLLFSVNTFKVIGKLNIPSGIKSR
jgi:hypothetical protein